MYVHIFGFMEGISALIFRNIASNKMMQVVHTSFIQDIFKLAEITADLAGMRTYQY